MSNTVRDPKGNELRLVILQVLSSDARGPLLLQVRHDDERIGLAGTPEHKRKFHMFWMPVDSDIGEVNMGELLSDFETMKELSEERERQRQQLSRDIAAIRKQVEDLEADNATKTEELRRLQRERDPDRLVGAINVAVANAGAGMAAELTQLKTTLATRDGEIRELKESKRRLKEANERLKKELAK